MGEYEKGSFGVVYLWCKICKKQVPIVIGK